MNKKTACFFAFVVGAAAGTLASWKYFKDKYERAGKEEVESIRAAFAEKRKNELNAMGEQLVEGFVSGFSETAKSKSPDEDAQKADNIRNYKRVVGELGYIDYSAMSCRAENSDCEDTPVEEPRDIPVIIDPEEFGEYDDYMQISLLYFADKILTDTDFNIVDDPNELIGPDALNHFGEYEEDAVHVRNDAKKCYYEILLEGRLYTDVLRKRPYLMDDME